MGSPQKVVIPKGLINPNETTIVEIPPNLQNVGTVVARPRNLNLAPPPGGWGKPKPLKKTYRRQSFPRTKPSYGYAHLPDELTIAGIPNEMTDDSISFQNPPRYPQITPPRPPPWSEISRKEDVAYGIGYNQPYEYAKQYSGVFKPTFEMASTPRGLDDPPEMTLYKDFKPHGRSSVPGSPGRSPMSMKHFHSSLGTVSPDVSQEAYYSSYITDSSGEGVRTDSTEEKSYYKYDEPECPCSGEESGADSSGAYQRFDSSSGMSPPSRKLTQREVLNSLGELEATELSQIMGDLNSFQNARRRLVFDASSLASAADVSNSLLNSSG